MTWRVFPTAGLVCVLAACAGPAAGPAVKAAASAEPIAQPAAATAPAPTPAPVVHQAAPEAASVTPPDAATREGRMAEALRNFEASKGATPAPAASAASSPTKARGKTRKPTVKAVAKTASGAAK